MNHISIFTKGAVLIAVPLLFQGTFLVLLVRAQSEAASAQTLAIHTKDVIARADRIYQDAFESLPEIRRRDLSAKSPSAAGSGDFRRRMTASVARLRRAVFDKPEQQIKVDRIGAAIDKYADRLEERSRSIDPAERLQDVKALNLLDEIRRRLDEFLLDEERLDRLRIDDMDRSRRRETAIVIVGGILGSLVSIAALAAFARGIALRLATLTDNVQRLVDGRELTSPVQGRDEIGRLDAVFHEMARSLVARTRENKTFVYSVSHDLRSPLVNLMGFSQELEDDCARLGRNLGSIDLPEKIRDETERILSGSIPESIHFLRTAVARVSAIIDALLRLSRSGHVEYDFRKVDVRTLITRVVESLRRTTREREATVNVGEDLSEVWGDPVALEQVFANLIGNALNYLDPLRPGIVEIGRVKDQVPSREAPDFVYYVKDNGLGIPEASHAKLFLPFQRFHADTTKGEGIGLALTRGIIQRHGGKIWATSQVGEGSTFFVSLPAESQIEPKLSVRDPKNVEF